MRKNNLTGRMEKPYAKSYLYTRIVDAKLFIDANYTEDIDIDQIASEACFSKFHFLRLFKQTYHVTPHQYLTQLKIRKAKTLLQSGASINQTCASIGFVSLSSFNKLFKRHVKAAPFEYACEVRQLHADINQNPLNHIPLCFIEYMHWDK
jgi:AraC-like DNA-binding protein